MNSSDAEICIIDDSVMPELNNHNAVTNNNHDFLLYSSRNGNKAKYSSQKVPKSKKKPLTSVPVSDVNLVDSDTVDALKRLSEIDGLVVSLTPSSSGTRVSSLSKTSADLEDYSTITKTYGKGVSCAKKSFGTEMNSEDEIEVIGRKLYNTNFKETSSKKPDKQSRMLTTTSKKNVLTSTNGRSKSLNMFKPTNTSRPLDQESSEMRCTLNHVNSSKNIRKIKFHKNQTSTENLPSMKPSGLMKPNRMMKTNVHPIITIE